MIDEARFVPADRGVDHDVIVDGEKEGMMPLLVDVGVARVRLGRRQPLPGIFDEARARGNRASGECTEPLNRRPANLEGIPAVRQGTFSAFGST